MPTSDLAKPMMHALIDSKEWQQYVRYLVEEFENVEQRYDSSCTALDQGIKLALRKMIEQPYKVAEVESPLMRKYEGALVPLQRKRRVRAIRGQAKIPLRIPGRQSGLV